MEESEQKINETSARHEPEAYLHVQRGPLTGKIIPLRLGTIEFGREFGYLIPDEHVSRRHASLTALPGEYLLSDLGSSNGTLLNGQQIMEPVKLQNGDIIQLGGTVMGFYLVGIQGNIIPGTGALTPETQPARLTGTTLLIKKNPKKP
jgi:pSer/pThr/pTyr-binding forkhead associated (FHA) protein